MKKPSLLLLLLFGLATSPLLAQEPTASECKQFHSGTFYTKGSMSNIVISRDDKFQTETDPATGKYVKMSITWTSDCTYELRLVKATMKGHKKAWKTIKVLSVTIISTDENSYRFSADSPAFPEAVTGTIIRK